MTPPSRVLSDIRLPSRYQIRRVIGRGGAGVVLQAHDGRLRRDVAIKVFSRAATTTETLIDQEREAQLLARSAHPNLVTIFDVGAEPGVDGRDRHLFLVMEYVDGPDLAQWLRLHRATVDEVVEIGAALCSALQFVHRNGVLHCDIKPSNVLLHRGPDGELIPKLADFGIAAVLRGQAPAGEFTVGTAAYLSPEQVEGDPLQEPSDVYALGLVLLEAATGRVAFPGGVMESALARLEEDPVVDDDLPDGLREALVGMTQRDPEQRWSLAEAKARFRSLDRDRDPSATPTGLLDLVVVDDVEEARPTLPALRTIGAGLTMPALDRAVAATARAVDATGALLLTVEGTAHVVQAVYGMTATEAIDLLQRRGVVLDEHESADLATKPISDTRGERLGVLAVLNARLTEQSRVLLADMAYLTGQILELRAATRRALLSR